MRYSPLFSSAILSLFVSGAALGAPEYAADVPDSILTPDEVETRLGTLRFFDGAPDADTVELMYDNLDFMRGVEAFLNGMPAASIYALCHGFAEAGIGPQSVGLFEGFMDARSLFLTANSSTVYLLRCYDLEDGPIVFEAPPGILGPLDDAYFRNVIDIGVTGPDKGEGGKYLLVGPGYEGDLPEEGYFIVHTPTYVNWQLSRAFVVDGDIEATVKAVKAKTRVYPWAMRNNPPETEFINMTGVKMNTVHANNFEFYEEMNAVIQKEPADALPTEMVGILASIGIKKGQPFAPDARMRAILEDAVKVGNATARSIIFAQRDPRGFYFEDRQWKTNFIGASSTFYDDGERMLDSRALFHYYATGITPAMAAKMVGQGSQYAYAERDADGAYLDGGKNYKITLPAPIPVNNFWAFTVYDNQTRSMLETDQRSAGIDSNKSDIIANEDGSYTVWFGPKAPEGHEANWVQTVTGKGWNSLLRLYGPLDPWFDKTWKPGDFERVQ
ncbi:MAG: DUF1254 domain-containing protein [Rhodobacteraceae bacterium]|nr:DUF1254 domain-containing protein [Paracoccaceae bacterium]